jgi:hypothetical protein
MRPALFAAVLVANLLPGLASASSSPAVEIYDRTDHRTLPVHAHEGRLYIAGEPGHQYEIRLRNRSSERLLAVTSVDGVNVISGETAETGQSGYVLAPWDSVEIDGWRKSLDEVATFYFTRLSNSYAARTGRPENVGVIGVAVFRERQRCCRHPPFHDQTLEERAAEAAPAEPQARADSDASRNSSPRRAREKLGTGHGHREDSPVEYVDFQRRSTTPEETIVIYYDSRKNLLARGVMLDSRRYAERSPSPFPNEFVPDP